MGLISRRADVCSETLFTSEKLLSVTGMNFMVYLTKFYASFTASTVRGDMWG